MSPEAVRAPESARMSRRRRGRSCRPGCRPARFRRCKRASGWRRDLLGRGVQPDHVRGQLAEPGPGRDGRGAAGAASSSARTPATGALSLLTCWLVMTTAWLGAVLRSLTSLVSRSIQPASAAASAWQTRAAAAFSAGLGTSLPGSSGRRRGSRQPQGRSGTGVAEAAPAATGSSSASTLGGGEVGAGGQGVHLPGGAPGERARGGTPAAGSPAHPCAVLRRSPARRWHRPGSTHAGGRGHRCT